jgi:hypothetical protein
MFSSVASEGFSRMIPFPGQILHLAADHAAGATAAGQLATTCGSDSCWISFGQNLKRQCQQAIAGQDGQRLAKFHMASWQAPTEVVIVHGRQVVVDERIGVNHLHGAGGRKCVLLLSTAGVDCE